MEDEEKYLFDLNGYLVVKNALDAEELQRINQAIDRHDLGGLLKSTDYFHTGFPDVMIGNHDPSRGPVDLEKGSLLDWGSEFRDLVDLPKIRPYLKELLQPGFRFDHSYGVFMRRREKNEVGMALHHGGTPYDPSQSYHFRDGKMHNGLLAVSYALTSVEAGDGGFCVIPGSHKANFALPDTLRQTDKNSPVRHVPLAAGDAVIFTEAATHGALPWRGENERRALFFKYCPGYMQWERASPGVVADDRFTDGQRSLLLGPFASTRRVYHPSA